ncbi:MAG: LysM peptidoglycan-binding domain-containing protein [Acetivibrionales bacterium]
MDNLIKLNASVISRMGIGNQYNDNNFYLDGRSKYDFDLEGVQVSIENSADGYLFAITDGMDREASDKNSSISMIKELKKFHDKMKKTHKDFEVGFDELCEYVEEVNNLVYSMLLGEEENSFGSSCCAGLIMDGNQAAALNIGECGVFLLRGGMLRQLNNNTKKAERLLRMGIITDEQAEVLSDRFDKHSGGDYSQVKRSDIFNLRTGDVFLLCNTELLSYVEEDRIIEILSLQKETDYISNALTREAMRNGAKDDLTAMVIRIQEIDGEDIIEPPLRRPVSRSSNSTYSPTNLSRSNRYWVKRRKKAIKKYASVLLAIVIVSGILFGLIKMFMFLSKIGDPGEEITGDPKQSQTDTSGVDLANESNANSEYEYSETEDNEDTVAEEEDNAQVTYTVQKGDTLFQITMRFYNDPQKMKLIVDANNLSDPNTISVGQVLIIPPAD